MSWVLLDLVPMSFWHGVTRLGEVQILLPAGLMAAASCALQHRGRPAAGRWLILLAAAMLFTLASKIAFIGWGWGWAALDFTGVSGHAMLSAALYPLMPMALIPLRSVVARGCAVALGTGLALLVGLSRVVVGAHSGSEVVLGLLMGATVTTAVLARWPQMREAAASDLDRGRPPWFAPAVMAWLVAAIAAVPPFGSHAMVTHLSLRLAGHATAHTRADMLRGRERPSPPADRGT